MKSSITRHLTDDQIHALNSLPMSEARESIQRMLYGKTKKQRTEIEADIKSWTTRLVAEESRLLDKRQRVEALKALEDWDEAGNFLLENNDCSRLHQLREAAALGRIINLHAEADSPAEATQHLSEIEQTFVVRHDWAGAFAGAEGIEDARLPYDYCAFEFRISGRNAIVLSVQADDRPIIHGLMVQCGDYWLRSRLKPEHSPFMRMVYDNIRAICIALDAEVATTEVVRAPHKLNEKRIKAGKSPLPDYRVVDLARRHRIANPAASTPGTGTKKRLHFRRGHWRHFDTSKTWVKWCLVGNPDLGFINKHYRL